VEKERRTPCFKVIHEQEKESKRKRDREKESER